MHNAVERSAVYGLLARLWAEEVDDNLHVALRQGALGTAFRAAGGEVTECKTVDLLRVDFCRLFLGPQGHIPPVQSVWQEGQFEGDAAASMRAYLDILGFPPPFGDRLAVDHAANGLAAFGALVSRVAESPAMKNDPVMHDLAASFFMAHVNWITELAEKMERLADTAFYRSLMRITRGFLSEELKRIQHRAESPSGAVH